MNWKDSMYGMVIAISNPSYVEKEKEIFVIIMDFYPQSNNYLCIKENGATILITIGEIKRILSSAEIEALNDSKKEDFYGGLTFYANLVDRLMQDIEVPETKKRK